jgi:hypothetical protein
MNEEIIIITHDILRSWNPCVKGYKAYCKLLPNGGTLDESIVALVNYGRDDWGRWIFDQCKNRYLFNETVSKGYRNSGNMNSGDWNSGNMNSGNWNSGDWNSGNWNSGDWNSGFFNNKSPEKILVFGKYVNRFDFESCIKPDFLYFDLCYWVDESEMTEKEKINDPNFYVRCGQLRKRDYKEAFKLSWENADKENRELIRLIPGFDAEIFFDISGIDLR